MSEFPAPTTERVPDERVIELGLPLIPTTADAELNPTPDSRTERRKDVLHNGERRMPNGKVYVTPDAEVMATIEQETDGKVTYFPVHDPKPDAFGLPGGNFHEVAFKPLCDELVRRYPDKRIALRGIMASVNGVQKDAMGLGKDIIDIADIAQAGIEKPGDVFNVQGMPEGGLGDGDQSLKHVSAYAEKTDFALRFYTDPTNETPADFRDAVFPAILVYDAAGLQSDRSDRFSATFREGVDPSQVLLGAYLLDRPQ